jgi:N-acetylated-alpha-linked acidic dipeptidase
MSRVLSRWLIACFTLLTAVSTPAAPPAVANGAPESSLLGFTSHTSAAQLALEARFDNGLNASEMRAWLERMAAEPNHVGSAHDRANAEFMLNLFRSWGFDARIETFKVLYPTPRKVALELVAPHAFKATLTEPAVAGDRTSSRTKEALPPYNVYGADGDVTAEVVYVNYGMPDDYKELARRGVSVTGKIAIARYGRGWRGLKPKLAQEHGAVGCLIYSDPRDDGYGAADPYPAGPGRAERSLQRGSVADMPLYSGDPLTPGVGATDDAPRLARDKAKSLLKIPVLPIAWADAKPILESLGGPLAPRSWRGGLPFAYHLGSGPARAHLTIESDWDLRPVYDVIAVLKGSEFPDEWVLRGNHHDGWVFGADDPLSGNVSMMGEMKAIGALAATGWKPRRTLVYASWDGEEAGLLGSTEWVETHGSELAQKAVAYVNSDSNSAGVLGMGGSHSLQRLMNEIAATVRDPSSDATVLAKSRASEILSGRHGDEDGRRTAEQLLRGADLPLEALGSGSDFTPFLQHAGIASLNLGFGNDEPSGVYHSIYDSYDHYIRFNDPDLRYGVALAQVAGRAMLRLANADVLPLRTEDFASAVSHYVDEIEATAQAMRRATEEEALLQQMHIYELAGSHNDPAAPPAREADVPFINFAPLHNAASLLMQSARRFDSVAQSVTKVGSDLSATQLSALNSTLRTLEQSLLGTPGLTGRPWYRHIVYAPGTYTGYGVKTLPGVREAVEERQFSQVDAAVKQAADALDAYRTKLDETTRLLNSQTP